MSTFAFQRVSRLFALAGAGLLLYASLSFFFGQKIASACPPGSRPTHGKLPRIEKQTLANGVVYWLTIPAGAPYRLAVGVSSGLAGVASPEWRTLAGVKAPMFLINAGFFDPNNRQTTSYLTHEGVLVGDPTQNARLMDNPKLASYLPAILNRSEFRVYACQAATAAAPETIRYDITPHNAPAPENCRVSEAVGGGPRLLPELTDKEEAFVDYDAQGRLTRDPIGVRSRNARSVIGLTARGDVLLMMGAQHPPKKPDKTQPDDQQTDTFGKGFTLPDMAAMLRSHGAVAAMALDGGSSSGLVYQGQAIYGKFSADGVPVKRPVKSVWMVLPR